MRPCPACLADSSKLLFQKEQVPFVECGRCAAVYVNPVPPTELLSSIYNELGTDYFTNPDKLAQDFRLDRFYRELAMVPPKVRGGQLLDVGCASGSFLVCAQQEGFIVSGIDISIPSVEYANKRIGMPVATAGDFLSQPFDASSFDLVTMWATLEYVEEAEAFVGEAYRVLKAGGFLCLSVPNRNGLSMRGLGAKYHMVGLEHLNYFTPSGLRGLLKRRGFSSTCVQTRAFNPIGFWKDWRGRHLSGDFSSSNLIADSQQNIRLRERQSVKIMQQMVDRIVKHFGVGDLLLVTAQKV